MSNLGAGNIPVVLPKMEKEKTRKTDLAAIFYPLLLKMSMGSKTDCTQAEKRNAVMQSKDH